MKLVAYGLFAPPAIQWLLSSEPDVFAAVQSFASDLAEPELTVAGPPDPVDERMAKKRGEPAPLPTVVLFMRKDFHHLTGAPFIEVACSDEHLVELTAWQARRRARAH